MKSFLVILLAVLALSSLFFYQDSIKNLRKSVKLNQATNPIITYLYNSTINSKQYASAQDQADASVLVTVSAAAELMINHTVAQKQYIVYVNYDNFDVKKLEEENGQEVPEDFTDENTTDDQIMYVAILNDSTGKLLSLQAPTPMSQDYSDLMNYVTVDILRLAFSQIKKYINSNEILDAEENHFGTVVPHADSYATDQYHIIKKWYSEEDFIDLKYQIGGNKPNINYEITTTLDQSEEQIISCAETNRFVAANNVQYHLVKGEDGEYEAEPIVLQNADVQSETHLDLANVQYDDDYFQEIQDYLGQTSYQEVDTTVDGEAVIYGDSSDIPSKAAVLNAVTPVYQYNYTIVKMSMLGQVFGIQADYDNYGTYSNISAFVFVNNKNIKTLYSIGYSHCPGPNRDINHDYSQNIPLFTVRWPILVILSIQFEASLDLDYGWKWYYGPDDLSTGCLIEFMPYFSSGIEASGDVSVKIAKAGMFATGYITQSYLNFTVQIKDAVTTTSKTIGGSVELLLDVNPFQYDIGAFYQLVKCSWKNFIHFHWKKMCTWGEQHQKVLISGKIGSTVKKVLFNKQYSIKV